MMRQTHRHGEPFTFTGGFGRADVERMNGLWRVVYDGRADWYAHLDEACTVASNLAKHGQPPVGISGLLERANRRAQ
jgi:hypothetical protein